MQGWPEPKIYTVYDRIFGDFPAKNTVYTPYIYGSGQLYIYAGLSQGVHDRAFGDFPAQNHLSYTVYVW